VALGSPSLLLILFLSIFFLRKRHVGVALIQLELIALYLLSLVLTGSNYLNLKTLTVYLLFCAIASEAALALSFLVILSRQLTKRLEKFSL